LVLVLGLVQVLVLVFPLNYLIYFPILHRVRVLVLVPVLVLVLELLVRRVLLVSFL
jgi:hypothetical protein